jgi:hypothetical protein
MAVFTAAVAVLSGPAWLVGTVSGQGSQAPERKLAPGVLVTIPSELTPDDTVSTHDVVEIRTNPALRWSPEFLAASDTLIGKASGVKFRRDIWGLEFSFKPLRMIEVDLPTRSGQVQRKPVWYLVYRVRNAGQTLVPMEGEGGIFSATTGPGKPRRFNSEFVLESHDRDSSGRPVRQVYLDRVLPAAVAAISQRERPGRPLLNSAEMAERPIPVSDGRIDRSVWGVATWTDIDPRMDFYSVYVAGLTNAYRWVDTPGAYQPGNPPGRGRRFTRKTLQLNFWRPGDERRPSEREIRYGVPVGMADLYGVADGVAHQWVYR